MATTTFISKIYFSPNPMSGWFRGRMFGSAIGVSLLCESVDKCIQITRNIWTTQSRKTLP